MTAEQLAQLAEILGMGADAMVEDVLAAVAAVVKKGAEAAAAPQPEVAPPEEMAAEGEPKPEEEEEKAVAASLVRLSGRKTVLEALSEVEAWKASHLELVDAKAKLAAEKLALETSERRKLVGELVKLGAEIPATAWSDDKGSVPCERLASEPLEGLRARVAKLTAARKGSSAAPRPPVATSSTGEGVAKTFKVGNAMVELSERELRICKEQGCAPETFAALKARRDSARTAGGN